MQISRFQYISNYRSEVSHFEQIKNVVEGGIKWIQYRPKDTTKVVIIEEGKRIAEFCKSHGVVFIMNDMVDVALELDADGVHLGKNDMVPNEARKILGKHKIIGGTANTAEDIIKLVELGVDYVGLGPYRFTETKKNLSPILGVTGYKEIISELQLKDIGIPVIAIGGIQKNDIQPILDTGIFGIAISSLVSEAKSITEKAKELVELLENKIPIQWKN